MSTAGPGTGGPGSGGTRGSRVLAGRYRLDEVIGRGGMSTVYRGTDLALDRIVAVKVAMDPLLERDPVYASRFKREARAAAALNNPGVVTVFDAGADGPTRYIVMEHVDGRDLSEILREEGPLEPPRAVDIARQIADTLAAAHAAGIVHRDIKPGNVMVTPQGRVKVLDFGIARTSDAITLTQTASVLGTAPYMSPEQAMGQPADARSDIYSLGCVLYEMLTGSPPFMGEVPAAVLHQHVRVAPKPPSERNPAVPPALGALVLEMLAKDPSERPQSAAELRDRLAALDTATEATRPLPPVEATRPLPAAEALTAGAAAAAEVPQVAAVPLSPAAAAETAPTRRVPPPGRPPGRGSGPWVALVLVALVLLGAAVAYAVTGGGSSGTTASSSDTGGHSAAATTTPPATTSHSSSTPTTSSTPSSSSSTSSSTPTSTTTTTTTTTTTPTAPGPPTPTPPGQGGVPPGQAKKAKPPKP